MRKIEDIKTEAENSSKIDRIILEVLLDIRELVAKKKGNE